MSYHQKHEKKCFFCSLKGIGKNVTETSLNTNDFDQVTKTEFTCQKTHGYLLKFVRKKSKPSYSTSKKFEFSESDSDGSVFENYNFTLSKNDNCSDENRHTLVCRKARHSEKDKSSDFNFSSSRNWIDDIKEFRRCNWFDCHADAEVRSERMNRLKETDYSQNETRYLLNDRLFLVPLIFNSKQITKHDSEIFPLSPDIRRPTDILGPSSSVSGFPLTDNKYCRNKRRTNSDLSTDSEKEKSDSVSIIDSNQGKNTTEENSKLNLNTDCLFRNHQALKSGYNANRVNSLKSTYRHKATGVSSNYAVNSTLKNQGGLLGSKEFCFKPVKKAFKQVTFMMDSMALRHQKGVQERYLSIK